MFDLYLTDGIGNNRGLLDLIQQRNQLTDDQKLQLSAQITKCSGADRMSEHLVHFFGNSQQFSTAITYNSN